MEEFVCYLRKLIIMRMFIQVATVFLYLVKGLACMQHFNKIRSRCTGMHCTNVSVMEGFRLSNTVVFPTMRVNSFLFNFLKCLVSFQIFYYN